MIARISTLCFAKHVNPQYKCPVVSMQKKKKVQLAPVLKVKNPISRLCTSAIVVSTANRKPYCSLVMNLMMSLSLPQTFL